MKKKSIIIAVAVVLISMNMVQIGNKITEKNVDINEIQALETSTRNLLSAVADICSEKKD